MTKFLFVIFIGALSFGAFQVGNWKSLSSKFNSEQLDQISKARILIAGDSHGERIWLPNSLNVSVGGDPLIIQLAIVEKILSLDQGEGINAIVLSVGPQNFSGLPIDRIDRNFESYIDGNTRRIHFLKDQLPSDLLNLEHFLSQGLSLSEGAPINLRSNQLKENDHDISEKRTKERLERHRVTQPNWFSRNRATTAALERFVNSNRTKLIIVGTPLHQTYLEKIIPVEFQKYQNFLDSLAQANCAVSYLSLENSRFPDVSFKDADHLNSKGTLQLCDSLLSYFNTQPMSSKSLSAE